MADFTRAEAAIESCAAHLTTSGAAGTEIEAFLTRYLAVLIYSVFQGQCESIIEARAAAIVDRHGAFYVRASRENVFRGMKIGDLAKYLGKFSPDCQAAFEASVTNTPAHVAYDNILNSRHITAHDTGTNMTFRELKEAFESAKDVIAAFEASIDVGRA